MRVQPAVGLLVFVAMLRLAGAEVQRFEVYPLSFADPRASEQAIHALVGEAGTVVLDEKNARLLVSTTAEKHEQIAGLMQKLNVRPKNVRIDVRFLDETTRKDVAAGLEPEGSIIIRDGDVRSTVRLNPRLKHETTTRASDVTQTLLVASGREGTLRVGEQVPYLEWFMDYGRRHGSVHGHVAWQDVGAHLVVQPTVVGDGPLVRVRITPELSGRAGRHPTHTRFASAATEVVVRDGQSFSLGGLDKDDAFYSRFLVGIDRSDTQRRLDITMTPHVLDP